MRHNSLILVTFFILTLSGCALPLAGSSTAGSATAGLAEQSSPNKGNSLADERYVALGTVSIAIPNAAAMSQTWYIDKATNRIIVCRILANMVNFQCLPNPLP